MSNFSTHFRAFAKFKKGVLRLLKRRYYAFLFRVITPFKKGLLRLSKRRYKFFSLCIVKPFLKALLRHFMHKRRNNAFSLDHIFYDF